MSESPTELPKGFQIETDESGHEWISYRTSGMGCLLWFLVILLVGVGGSFALVANHDPAGMLRLFDSTGASIGLGCGLVAMAYFVWFLMFHLFGTTFFGLRPSELTIRKRLFGLSLAKSIDRDKMECFEQIKDGGEGDDSFPSWGLNLLAGRRFRLLSRQPIEKSDWLGPKLAEFFGIEFKRCSRRE
ncbi:MAG: hypothetical protein IAG10_19620 [Planctomycetaceae bacterium]|nr:hypothetical protein [Planctomycetaceae bacterium]